MGGFVGRAGRRFGRVCGGDAAASETVRHLEAICTLEGFVFNLSDGYMSQTPLLPPTFLFRFSARCLPFSGKWGAKGVSLTAKHSLPQFEEMNEGKESFADVRVGWSAAGLGLVLKVTGKQQSLWCKQTKLGESDGIHLWFDTRDTHDIHRATRFCHRFFFMPQGDGVREMEPYATMLKINRAKEESSSMNRGKVQIRSVVKKDGYELNALIPKEALFGFAPDDQRQLGFCYAINDRELGWQCFSISPKFPIAEDPSLWGTLELISK